MGTEPVVAWNATEWTSLRLTFKRVLEIWIDSETTQGLMLTILVRHNQLNSAAWSNDLRDEGGYNRDLCRTDDDDVWLI